MNTRTGLSKRELCNCTVNAIMIPGTSFLKPRYSPRFQLEYQKSAGNKCTTFCELKVLYVLIWIFSPLRPLLRENSHTVGNVSAEASGYKSDEYTGSAITKGNNCPWIRIRAEDGSKTRSKSILNHRTTVFKSHRWTLFKPLPLFTGLRRT